MTALFIVIFTEQWLTNKNHTPALIGAAAGTAFIVLLGGDKFLLPALAVSVGGLLINQKREEAAGNADRL